MLFKVDESLPAAAAEVLRATGHDALMVQDQGLGGATDEEIDAICRSERRALLTLDRGFGDPRRHGPHGSSGIVVLRPVAQDRDHVLALLRAVLPELAEERLRDALWIVEPHRIRIRRT